MGRIIVKAARVATLRLELLVAWPGGGVGRRRSGRGTAATAGVGLVAGHHELGCARSPTDLVLELDARPTRRADLAAARRRNRHVGDEPIARGYTRRQPETTVLYSVEDRTAPETTVHYSVEDRAAQRGHVDSAELLAELLRIKRFEASVIVARWSTEHEVLGLIDELSAGDCGALVAGFEVLGLEGRRARRAGDRRRRRSPSPRRQRPG